MTIHSPISSNLFGPNGIGPTAIGQKLDVAVGDCYVYGDPWDKDRIFCKVDAILVNGDDLPRVIVLAEMKTNGKVLYETDATLELLMHNDRVRPLALDPFSAAGQRRKSGLGLEIGNCTWQETKAWYAQKVYFHDDFATSQPAVEKIMAKLKNAPKDVRIPSASTVLREIEKNLGNNWYDPVETAMSKSTVVIKPSAFGQDLEKLIQRCLFKALKRPKGRSTHALAFLQKLFKRRKLPLEGLPDIRTIQRRMKRIPAYVRCYLRHGPEIAAKRHGSIVRCLLPEAPLVTAEVDDLELDCEVCDDVSLIPLGRPWLIMIRDRRTGIILGYSIAIGAPSFESFIEALEHAWKPKDMEAYPGLEWRFHGKFLFLVVDRASHFVGHGMGLAAKHLSFDVVELAPASPQLKGGLEAANKYINEEVPHNSPGAVMGSPEERKLHEATRVRPMLKLSELRFLIVHFICTRMNVMPKKGIGLTRNMVGVPGAIWDREVRKIQRRPLGNPHIFARLAGDRKRLTIQRQGVTFDYITYWAPELAVIASNHPKGTKFDCLRNANNLAGIWIFPSPADAPLYLPVCPADAGYATGLGKPLHGLLKGRAKVDENEARAAMLLSEHFNAAVEFSDEIDRVRKDHDVETIMARLMKREKNLQVASTITRSTYSPDASADFSDLMDPPWVPETEALSPNASPIHRVPDPEKSGQARQYELKGNRMAEVDRGAPAPPKASPQGPTEAEMAAELERIAAMKRARGRTK